MNLLRFVVPALVVCAPMASADVIFDESTDGDLSSDPASPTPLALSVGSNTVVASVEDSDDDVAGDRDFFTITIEPNQMLTSLVLLTWDPDDPGFFAVNEGTTSFIPDVDTINEWLAGILTFGSDVDTDLLERFVDRSVTTNSLPEAELGPGDYSFVMQQTGDLVQRYALEFQVSEDPVPTIESSWGEVKRLYR